MREIYVGNLRYDVSVDDVRDVFLPFGAVDSVTLFTESAPGHPHAYAFVVMENAAADAAIDALDSLDFMGLTLRVEEARLARAA